MGDGPVADGVTWHDCLDRARRVLDTCSAQGLRIATAESCTGGLVAGALTAIAGSSAVVDSGVITYDNAAKVRLLGVDPTLFDRVGAVSAEVAGAMADGLLARAPVDLTVSVTGIAGPGGATPAKPIGLVFIGCARAGRTTRTARHHFPGDRTAVRLASVHAALGLVLEACAD